MRSIIKTLFSFILMAALLTSVSCSREPEKKTIEENYIEINGIKVAKGNLISNGMNGAKIGKPTDGGLYFQFGSLIGWSETGDNPTIVAKPIGYTGSTTWSKNWKGSPSNENVALGTGDPCKHYLGRTWRLPTKEECKTIINEANNSTSWQAIEGWSWHSSPAGMLHHSGLFFPAFGYRSGSNGHLSLLGSDSYYWSASPSGDSNGYGLFANNNFVSPHDNNIRSDGFTIRCVQDK